MSNSLLKLSQSYASGQLTKKAYRFQRRRLIEQSLDFEEDLTKPDNKCLTIDPKKDSVFLEKKFEPLEQVENNTPQVNTNINFFCRVSKVFILIVTLGAFGLSFLFFGNRNCESLLIENLVYRQRSIEQNLSEFTKDLNVKESFTDKKLHITSSLSQNDSFKTLNQVFDAAILDGAIDSFEHQKFLEYWDNLLPEEKEDWLSLVGLNLDQYSSSSHLENKVKGFGNLLDAIRKHKER